MARDVVALKMTGWAEIVGYIRSAAPGSEDHVDGERQHRQLKFPAFDSLGIDPDRRRAIPLLVKIDGME